MKSKPVLILHTISDAKHCLKNELHREYALFCTDVTVEIYFQQVFQVDCPCLSRRLSTEEILSCQDRAAELFEDLAIRADQTIDPHLNKLLGVKMSYFRPLYACVGKFQLSGYLTFALALGHFLSEAKPTSLVLYDYQFNSHFNTSSDMELFMKTVFIKERVRILKYAKPADSRNLLNRIWVLARNACNNPRLFTTHIGQRLRLGSSSFSHNDKTKEGILVHEPLYDLEFIKKTLKTKNLLLYRDGDPSLVGLESEPMSLDLTSVFSAFVSESQTLDQNVAMLANDISSDFKKNQQLYLESISCLKNLHQKYPLSLGVWGLPPISGPAALLFEYLRSAGVKVVGAQHGALYGDTFLPKHLDSDFSRCDYYISYGFTSEDLKRLYPKADIQPKILPFGPAGRWANLPVTRRKEIDILFPPTFSFSLFRGVSRMPSHVVTDNQLALIRYLDSLVDLKIHIKPFMYSGYKNCATWSLLTRLKKAKLIDYLTLTEYLQTHKPKVVVVEYPSTPLYDCLKLDTEIFLITDKVHPFEEKAAELLARRVHLSETAGEMIDQLALFRQGKLDSKRDQSFADHYLRNEKTKERISNFISELI